MLSEVIDYSNLFRKTCYRDDTSSQVVGLGVYSSVLDESISHRHSVIIELSWRGIVGD